jgi:hypothetical protein
MMISRLAEEGVAGALGEVDGAGERVGLHAGGGVDRVAEEAVARVQAPHHCETLYHIM